MPSAVADVVSRSSYERADVGNCSLKMIECLSCGRRQEPSLICAECGAPLAAPLDCFSALGLPRKLTIDLDALERRYHELSRKIHPDRFASKRPQDPRRESARDRDADPQLSHAARPGRSRPLLARTQRREARREQQARSARAGRAGLRSAGATRRDAAMSDPEEAHRARDRNRRARVSSFNSRWMKRWPSSSEISRNGTQPAQIKKMLTLELKTILSNIAYLRTLIRDVDRALENSKAA